MKTLLNEIKQCTICEKHLKSGVRPIMAASAKSRILIIGQAPGRKVHESGIPWDDKSGEKLRDWLGVTKTSFYNPDHFGILPMGFCYPGKATTGDLPPRSECAPQWHPRLLEKMDRVALILLIGRYGQKYYLKNEAGKNLTQTVAAWQNYLPHYFPLPHPSPLNFRWQRKNPWFETEVVPELKKRVGLILKA